MSKIVVVINNNLESDARVLRQVKTFAEVFDEVVIYARPIPEKKETFTAKNVKWMFYEDSEYKGLSWLRDICEIHGILDEMKSIEPLIMESEEPISSLKADIMINHQNIRMMSDRWREVRAGIPADSSVTDEMIWIQLNLNSFIGWADEVSKEPADVIYCNDVDTLLCGVMHKKRFGSRLVYDEHDIYADAFPGLFPRYYRNFIALFEFKFTQYADALISVSFAATQWLSNTYSLTIPAFVITNAKDVELLTRSEDSFNNKTPIVYYHGLVSRGRGIEEIIDALALHDSIKFAIRTIHCEYLEAIKEKIVDQGLQDRVILLDFLDQGDVLTAANTGGDIGINIGGKDSSIGIRFSLTNKFIEYLSAGLPVITTSTMIEQAGIVEKYKCGFVTSDDTVESLDLVLREIEKHPEQLAQMSEFAHIAAAELFDWAANRELLIKIVTGNAGSKDGIKDSLTDTRRAKLRKGDKKADKKAGKFLRRFNRKSTAVHEEKIF